MKREREIDYRRNKKMEPSVKCPQSVVNCHPVTPATFRPLQTKEWYEWPSQHSQYEGRPSRRDGYSLNETLNDVGALNETRE